MQIVAYISPIGVPQSSTTNRRIRATIWFNINSRHPRMINRQSYIITRQSLPVDNKYLISSIRTHLSIIHRFPKINQYSTI